MVILEHGIAVSPDILISLTQGKEKHIYFIKGMMTLVKLGFFRIWRSNGRIDILLSLII